MPFITQKNVAITLVAIGFHEKLPSNYLGVEITINLQGVKNHILKVVIEMDVNPLKIIRELKMEFRPIQEITSR